jgi:hypothetical protein
MACFGYEEWRSLVILVRAGMAVWGVREWRGCGDWLRVCLLRGISIMFRLQARSRFRGVARLYY